MKRGTPQHPKVDSLMERLNIPRWQAVGLLESLWHVAQMFAPRGDIGKFTNRQIATRLDYRDDPDELIAALYDSKWLDVCTVHRLVIHDWTQHCDQTTQRRDEVKKHGFATPTPPKENDDASKLLAGCYENAIQPLPLPLPTPEPEPLPGAEAPAPADESNGTETAPSPSEPPEPDPVIVQAMATDYCKLAKLPDRVKAFREIRGLLDHFTESEVRHAIGMASPQDKPWSLRDRLAGVGPPGGNGHGGNGRNGNGHHDGAPSGIPMYDRRKYE